MKVISGKQKQEDLNQAENFYLQDSRGNLGSVMMFWKNGGGYTSDLEQAEIFSKEKAIQMNRSRDTDKPWPVNYLQSLSHPVVDMQLLRGGVGQVDASTSPDEPCVAVVAKKYDGNSIFYLDRNGSPTKNLDEAKVYLAHDLSEVQGSPNLTLLKKQSLEEIRFMVVNAKDCKKSMCLIASKPKKMGPSA